MIVRFVTKPNAVLISEKEFKKILAQTDDKTASEDPPKDAKFQTKKNQKTDKETKAKKTDKFKNVNGGSDEAPAGGKGFGSAKKSKLHKAGDSSTDDDLGDIKIGPQTILNGKEYKFFNYYDRIREQVSDRWHPKVKKAIEVIKHKKDDPNPLTSGSKITGLVITLNKNGEIILIELVKGSSYKELDDAAIESFREAAPFAHPPDELVKNGTFTLDWDFTLNVEDAPIVKFEGGS